MLYLTSPPQLALKSGLFALCLLQLPFSHTPTASCYIKQWKWDTSLKFLHISIGKHPIFWGFLTSKQDLLLSGSQPQRIFSVLCFPCSFQAVPISSLVPEDHRAVNAGSWAQGDLGSLGSVQQPRCAGSAHEEPQPHWKFLIKTQQQHLTPNCFVWEFSVKHPESVITPAIDGTSWSPSGYLIDCRLMLRKMQLVGAWAVY